MGFFKPNVKKMEAKKDVEGLIKALKDTHVRHYTAEALIKIKDAKAVEPLIQALKDEDYFVREAAARALGEIKDKRAVEPLLEALGDEWWNVRLDAAMALGKIGDAKAVEPLIKALKDRNETVRGSAAKALGEIGEPVVEPLIQALKDESSMVRKAAARILKRFSTERTREALEEYEEREREAAEKRKRKAKAKGRIRHLLILLEEEPVEEGLGGAVSSVLNNASYKTGKPYHNFVDAKTKIQVAVTGPEDYNEAYIFAAAKTHFPEIEAKKLRYNKFYRVDGQGRRSAGVVVSD